MSPPLFFLYPTRFVLQNLGKSVGFKTEFYIFTIFSKNTGETQSILLRFGTLELESMDIYIVAGSHAKAPLDPIFRV